jgi:hypothetical protein
MAPLSVDRTELGLFEQYLIKLRQEKLQQSHAWAIGSTSTADYTPVRILGHEAELCGRMLTALRVLGIDPGKFIKEYLQ